MTNKLLPLVACGFSLAVVGCGGGDVQPGQPESVQSKDFSTDRLYPIYVLQAFADGTTLATAQWDTSGLGSRHAHLSEGDKLLISGAGTSQFATDCGTDARLLKFYCARFQTNAADARFTFDFQRASHVSAPESFASLPPPFSLAEPVGGETYSYNNGVVRLRWTPTSTGNAMHIRIRAICEDGKSTQTNPIGQVLSDRDIDLGRADFDLNTMRGAFDSACKRYKASLSLVRLKGGTLDKKFAPGDECDANGGCGRSDYFNVEQVRTAQNIALVP